MSATVTTEEVFQELHNVIDPELGLDFVELGLIYDVEINQGEVKVIYTLTTMGCPIGPQIEDEIKDFVGALAGVTQVEVEMVYSPPWTPEMMSEDAKFALGFAF